MFLRGEQRGASSCPTLGLHGRRIPQICSPRGAARQSPERAVSWHAWQLARWVPA